MCDTIPVHLLTGSGSQLSIGIVDTVTNEVCNDFYNPAGLDVSRSDHKVTAKTSDLKIKCDCTIKMPHLNIKCNCSTKWNGY